jgi:uncharacterized NAD(P)/FAD-binding protein YdhS
MAAALHIGIIGGGFSGVSVAAQLAQQAKSRITVYLFNFKYPVAKGIAYSTADHHHLMNVPAASLSFFHNDPYHFSQWLDQYYPEKYTDAQGNHLLSFVPRKIYGDYILDTFNRTLIHSTIDYKLINEEVVSLTHNQNAFELTMQNGNIVLCDQVILATGNQLPVKPPYISDEMEQKQFYLHNPWDYEKIKSTKPEEVLLIGCGLTAVDVAITLLEKYKNINITACSPHGRWPMTYNIHDQPFANMELLLSEISSSARLLTLFSQLNIALKKHLRKGSSAGSFVASIRPFTASLWQQLSITDKLAFMRHLKHYWSVSRHRMPEEAAHKIEQFQNEGRLKVIKGRIQSCQVQDDRLLIELKQHTELTQLHTNLIINCTGPVSDMLQSQLPLYKKLLQQNLLPIDPVLKSISSDKNFRIPLNTATPHNALFGIGPVLKGTFWETTAVAEIKEQAESIARQIVSK